MSYQIEGLTIAVNHMEEMCGFYNALFGIEFQKQEMHGFELYQGKWGEMNLLFCPANLAQNTAKQNRHQFDIIVDDLDETIQLAKANGGELMNDPQSNEWGLSVGIYDPDHNSMVFKQPA